MNISNKDEIITDYIRISETNLNMLDINKNNYIIYSENLNILKIIPDESIDLIYMDPPFFTRYKHTLKGKRVYSDAIEELSFSDIWNDRIDYIEFMHERLTECYRILKSTGSLYLHCDWHASHTLRMVLDNIFSEKQFRNEIIWFYKRWTNSKKSFQKSHDTIYLYSKTDDYNFNTIYDDYSYTTNIDQIWQERTRDNNNKSTYKKQGTESVALNKDKKGVPKRDVWELPYLNPKAKERTGYPTQKPVHLLLPIINASSNPGDVVLDPFVGSGTTLVAAAISGRRWIGIDNNLDAIKICEERFSSNITEKLSITRKTPYKIGKFKKLSREEKIHYISDKIPMNIVRRNRNLDGILKDSGDWDQVGLIYYEKGNLSNRINDFIAALKMRNIELGLIFITKMKNEEKELVEQSYRKEHGIKIITFSDIQSDDKIRNIRSRK